MRIAVIGGIGSGKSEALAVAARLGYATLSADKINSALLEDASYIALIAQAFPTAVSDGKVNKAALAKIVFSDNSRLKLLNSIAHPRILQKIKDDPNDTLVVEMPVIIECSASKLFDEILLIRTPILRRLAFLRRRGMSLSDAVRRIKSQTPLPELKKIATHTVYNSSSIKNLERKVANWLTRFQREPERYGKNS